MSLRKFMSCESGATSIEYGLIAAFIGVAIIGVLQTVGQEVKGPFVDAQTGLQKRTSP